MIFDDQHPSAALEDDARTFSVLQEIANEIDPDIQMTVDVPSMHENSRLPVLDLGLQVVTNKVQFFFYRKEMTSPYTIMYKSAISANTKRDTLLQEGLRRLRNTCPEAPEGEIIQTMSEYINVLRISGYDERYRYTLLKGILERRRQMNEKIEAGTWTRYRSRQQIILQKAKSLGKYANTWFLRGDTMNTLMIQLTPNS